MQMNVPEPSDGVFEGSHNENELWNIAFEILNTPYELQIVQMNFQMLHLNLEWCIWDFQHITGTSDHENELSINALELLNDGFEISDTPPELQIMEMNFQTLHLSF